MAAGLGDVFTSTGQDPVYDRVALPSPEAPSCWLPTPERDPTERDGYERSRPRCWWSWSCSRRGRTGGSSRGSGSPRRPPRSLPPRTQPANHRPSPAPAAPRWPGWPRSRRKRSPACKRENNGVRKSCLRASAGRRVPGAGPLPGTGRGRVTHGETAGWPSRRLGGGQSICKSRTGRGGPLSQEEVQVWACFLPLL